MSPKRKGLFIEITEEQEKALLTLVSHERCRTGYRITKADIIRRLIMNALTLSGKADP